MSDALIVFVRFPSPGKVKTRLAQSIGNEQATEFYYTCADAILREISRLTGEVERYIFYSDKIDENKIKRWIGPEFHFMLQEGDTLGQRLENALNNVFGNGAHKAMVIASDVPDLSVDILNEAMQALDKSDIVIGPCYDGGYYLIGMKRLYPELFQGISWSTPKVYRQTLDIINEKMLTVYQLQTLIDIDSQTDLCQWAEMDGYKKPALAEYLKTIGRKPALRRS